MVPTRAAAAALFLSLSPSMWLQRHAAAVADVASFLAVGVQHDGHVVDRSLVETAALLHDLDKALPPDHPMRALGHGHAGARWLIDHGYEELAPAVDSHPVGRLSVGSYDEWARTTTLEQRIVAYADKRAQRRVVSLDARFARWERRHPDQGEWLTTARRNATQLELEICGLAGVSPDGVRRRPWSAAAFRNAASRADPSRSASDRA